MFTNQTEHKILFKDSKNLDEIENQSIDLVVTSPPYPMITMWDEMFFKQNQKIKESIDNEDGYITYTLMHQELNKTWREVDRVLKEGGMACINIGDATRTMNGIFKLYPNHSPILEAFLSLGFDSLPTILWRKATNAPNKFMGSGMLPVGAYVTLEHERILIFRKKRKREFVGDEEKDNRMKSAFFYSERNKWFSDIWDDVRGTQQILKEEGVRERSGAYPLELPYRLINMFSVKGDTVLDPFLGTGTTSAAAVITGRSSIGIEKEKKFEKVIDKTIVHSIKSAEDLVQKRIDAYIDFIEQREKSGKTCKYKNIFYSFPVVTKQEQKICFDVPIEKIDTGPESFLVSHEFFSYR